MDGQLTEAEKSFRSEKMIELHHRHAGDYEKSMLGKKPGGTDRGRVYKGWTDLVSGTQPGVY